MTYFITGVGSGIGRATCLHALEKGHVVIGTLRSRVQLESLEKESQKLSGNLNIIEVDFNDVTWKETIKGGLDKLSISKIEYLINIAGVLSIQDFEEINSEEINRVMHLNFTIPVMLCQLLFPYLKESDLSSIVNITSMSGYPGSVRFPGLSVYGASKAALGSFTESLAAEIGEYGVRSNALAIGAVNTKMLKEAFPEFTAEVDPSEMGRYICNFAEEGSRLLNGKVLSVALTNP